VQPTGRKILPLGGLRFAEPPCQAFWEGEAPAEPGHVARQEPRPLEFVEWVEQDAKPTGSLPRQKLLILSFWSFVP
jgi:hypothetical protein